MLDFTRFAHKLQDLFGEVANELAFSTGLRVRASKLGGSQLAQALIGGWWANPKASRSELAALVGVSKQALDQSLNEKAAHYLHALLEWCVEQVIELEPTALPLLERFKAVYALDSSTISLPQELAQVWPGCGKVGTKSNAGLKLHLALDLKSGTLIGPHLSQARTHDQKGPHQELALEAGALRIADLGYFKLDRFASLEQAGVYFLSKAQAGLVIYDPSQPAQGRSLNQWLAEQVQNGSRVDRRVLIGSNEKLACRLVGWQVPGPVAAARQIKLEEVACKRQRETSPEQTALSYWTVYLTNVPVAKMSLEEAAVLYRLRWQIELLFKLWKSQGGGLEEWQSQKPWAIMCEIYAKLIGQVVQHWLLRLSVWQEPGRSLVKVSRLLRGEVRGLLGHLAVLSELKAQIGRICQLLGQAGRLERRKGRPCSYQLIKTPPSLVLLN